MVRQYIYRKQESFLAELKKWEKSKQIFFDIQTAQRQVQLPPIPPATAPTPAIAITSNLIMTAYNKGDDSRHVYMELVKEAVITTQAEMDGITKELTAFEESLKELLRKELSDFDKINGMVE